MSTSPTTNSVMLLSDLRNTVLQEADMVNSNFISQGELTGYVNQSLYELYDLLIVNAGDDYFISQYLFTTTGTTQLYALPPDFYKVKGLDIFLQAGANPSGIGWLTLQNFEFTDRNRYTLPNYATLYGFVNIRYRLNGSNLLLTPQPLGGQQLRLWYVPRLIPVTDSPTITCSGVQVGDSVTITVNGGTTYTFTGVASGATGTQFNVTVGNDTANATALAAAIQAQSANLGYIAAAASVNVVSLTLPNLPTQVQWSVSNNDLQLACLGFSVAPPTFQNWTDGISGWTQYVVEDCVIKCLAKEETDPSVHVLAKTALIQRITTMSANRNQGDGPTTSITQPDSFWGGFPGMQWPPSW